MRIFIDEAGAFLPPTSQRHSYSLVLALIVPSSCEQELCYQFLRLRDSWPAQQVEIKGSALAESEASQIIDLLASFDVVVDFVSVDMALHTDDIMDDWKARQAALITANITREHHSEMVQQLVQLDRTVRNMPNQLFLQAELTIQLILAVVQIATLYLPVRLAVVGRDIAWVVDRKGHTLTSMEETWSTLILPMSENHFMKQPLIMLEGADYSSFARYEIVPAHDQTMARHVKWVAETYGKEEPDLEKPVTDPRRLLTEQLQFLDSRESLGLQLADMLASILRRALNGHLQKAGWKNFGKLVVHDPKPGWFSRLGPKVPEPESPQTAYAVWETLKASSKSMLSKRPQANDQQPPLQGARGCSGAS